MSWPVNTIIGQCIGLSKVKAEGYDYRSSQLNKPAPYVTGISIPAEFDPDVGPSIYALGCPRHRMTVHTEERRTKDGVRICGFLPEEGDTIQSEEEGGEDVETPPEDPCAPPNFEVVYSTKVVVKEGNYFGKHVTTYTYGKGEGGIGCVINEVIDDEGYCAGGTANPDEPAPEPDPVTGITPPVTKYNKVVTVSTTEGSYTSPDNSNCPDFPGQSSSTNTYFSETTSTSYSCFPPDPAPPDTTTASSDLSWTDNFCDTSISGTCSSSLQADGSWEGDVSYAGDQYKVYEPCADSIGETLVVSTYSEPVPYNAGSVTLSGPIPGFDAADWDEWEDDYQGWSNGLEVRNRIRSDGGYQRKGKYGSWVQRCNIGEQYTFFMIKTTGPGVSTCFSTVDFEPECMDYEYVTETFTATKPVEFFDCSLNSGVSEDAFISNNYSISPEDYNLPANEIVVGSPSRELAVPAENYCIELIGLFSNVNVDRTFLL